MSTDQLKLTPDNMLCFSIYAASREIISLYRPILAKFGLTYPQFLVMTVLWEAGNSSVSDIGDELMLDSGTLTPLLKRMEEADLISRKRSATDERRVEISLTSKGQSLQSELYNVPGSIFSDLCKTDDNYYDTLGHIRQLLTSVKNYSHE